MQTSDSTAYRSTLGIVLGAAALLLVPLIAMQFTDEVVWTGSDFLIAFVLLAGTGLLYQAATRRTRDRVYRGAAALGVFTTLFLIWANLAVGLIGSESDPANRMYLGVLAVLLVGSALARFRPAGMARTMYAAAAAHVLIAAIAIGFGYGEPQNGAIEIVLVNAMFVALFAGSGALFQRAAEPRGED